MTIPYGREWPEPEWPDPSDDEPLPPEPTMPVRLDERRQFATVLTVGTPAHLRHPVLDWKQTFEGAPEDVEWLIPDFIARGRAYSIVATAKAGKSLIMLDVAASLATGRSALGHPPQAPERVLYVDLENSRDDIADRLRDMDYRPDQLGNLRYLSFPSMPALDSAAGGRDLLELAEHHDAALVIIDTLARVVAGDENSADTYRALYRHALAPLKAQGRAVTRLDHLGKSVEAGARGSSAKNDDVDAVWVLSQKVESDGTARVGLRLDRQRGNAHPPQVRVLREVDPVLRHVAQEPDLSIGDRTRVAACIEQMKRIGLDSDTGGRKARAALRAAGFRAGNDIVAAAVKARKATAPTCPQNPADTLFPDTSPEVADTW